MSIEEKYDLLDALWMDIASQPDAVPTSWKQELNDREAVYRQNPADTLSWEDVRKEQRSR